MIKNTDEQEDAINENSKYLGILASAGSGKTRVLVERMAKLINIDNIPPSSIIAFTYTDRAAEELKARVYSRLSHSISAEEFYQMYVGTIHSYCHQLLQNADYNDFFYNFDLIKDNFQLESLIDRLYDFLELERAYRSRYRDRNIKNFIRDYEIYENEALNIEDVPQHLRSPFDRFNHTLLENRLLTFGSMIRYSIKVINRNKGLKNLRHLLVDEYQDVNPAQISLVKSLVQNGSKLTVVGDDLQSIYQWRGSDVKYIINFEEEWKGKTCFLSTNFRSRRDIVITAEKFSKSINPRCINPNKKMIPHIKDRADNKNIHWINCRSKQEQSDIIVYLVKSALKNGYSLNEIGILVRLRNAMPDIIKALQQNNIRCYCPQISVVKGEELKNMLMYLFSYLSFPEKNDAGKSHSRSIFKNFSDLFYKFKSDRASITRSTLLITEWKKEVHNTMKEEGISTLNIRSWLFRFFDESGLKWGLEDIDILSQLGLITKTIRSCEEINRRTLNNAPKRNALDIYKELSHELQNKGDTSKDVGSNSKNIEAILIATIHQAKGLEWPVILIPDITYNHFPLAERKFNSSYSSDITKRYNTSEMDERRLFYVAMTRGREHVMLLSYPNQETHSPFLYSNNTIQLINPTTDLENIEFNKTIENEDKEELIPIGVSDLLILLECPFQYCLRKIYGIFPPVDDALGFGKSLHEIIKRCIKDGKWKSKRELDLIAETHIHMPLENEDELVRDKATIKRIIHELSHVEDLYNISVNELPIRVKINSVEITGIIDSCIENSDGSITVIDWKTSLHDEYLSRYESQMQLYTYSLRQQGKTVKAAKVIDVSRTAREGKVIFHNVDIADDKIRIILKEVDRKAEIVKSLNFKPNVSKNICIICDTKDICKYKLNEEISPLVQYPEISI